jgi:hypothetical protein
MSNPAPALDPKQTALLVMDFQRESWTGCPASTVC